MGERRGCLIYSFHCCRRSSLLLSVREGKWSMHTGKKKPKKRSQSHFLSTFLMAHFRVCLVLRLLVFPPLLPFPQFVTRSQGDLCSLLASTLQTGETIGSGTEWGEVERLTSLCWLVQNTKNSLNSLLTTSRVNAAADVECLVRTQSAQHSNTICPVFPPFTPCV